MTIRAGVTSGPNVEFDLGAWRPVVCIMDINTFEFGATRGMAREQECGSHLGSSRTRWFNWFNLLLNPHIAWYAKPHPVTAIKISCAAFSFGPLRRTGK